MMRYLWAFVLLLMPSAKGAEGAEMRTWTAASGGFTIEAELVDLKGDSVRLKTKDGRVLEVPLSQLSAADQAFARPAPAGGAAPIAASMVMPAKPSTALTRALKSADRCRLPDEAMVILKVFYDDPQQAAEERAYAAGRLAELKDPAAKKMVRVNKAWVTAEEAAAVRAKADTLMRQGLALLKLKQFDTCQRKFNEAAALEPEQIRAEFLLALVYTLGRDYAKALPAYQKALIRDPENITLLNNAAMLAVAKADFNSALSHWRRALDSHPDQKVMHNVGRFLAQSQRGGVKVPKNVTDGLALPYTEQIATGRFEGTDDKVGWLLMLIEKSDLDIALADDDDKEPEQKSPAPEPNDDGTVIGSGTGFVVHPGYVLTNAHVAMDDAAYEIQAPDGTRHKATRVAADKELDLALLKCEPLTAPALVLNDAIVPRGTDVMLFGYPEMLVLGTSLKATRGSISSLPDPKVNSKYLYDAVSNSGNSGGPLCDAGANVVAVHSTGYNTASRYAGGIPSTQAIEFVNKALPEFQPSAPSATKLEWPKVDERASASTMLIWIRKKNARVETASVGGDVIELPFCLFCGGKGSCTVCQGAGIDLELASVKRALAAANAANPPAASTTGTSSPPSNSPTGSSRPPPQPYSGKTFPLAAGRPIDVMAGFNPNQPYSPGSWQRRGPSIVGGGAENARFALGPKPPKEYDLEFELRELKPADRGITEMWVGLITSSGQTFHLLLRDKHIGRVLDEQASSSSSVASMDLKSRVMVRIQMRERDIVVMVKGASVYGHSIDPNKRAARKAWELSGNDVGRLSVGSTRPGCLWEISGMKLIPLD
jgi:S1-C subfamily serine protease